MNIGIRFESSLRDIAGVPAMDIDMPEGATVRDLLDTVARIFGTKIFGNDPEYNWRHSANYVVLLKNGEALAQGRYVETPLNEGDVVSLVPPLAGG